MARMKNSLITGGGRFGPTDDSYIANIEDGGQNGFGPLLKNLDAATPPVWLPAQIVVIRAPTVFEYIPNGVRFFKALFETHCISMTGLDVQHSMETDGTPVGKDGQQLLVPTKHVRTQISPNGTWAEKIGNVVWNTFLFWMNAMHDIDTQAASLAGLVPRSTILPPHVLSMWSADLLIIQHDGTYRPENVQAAMALTNFFPTDIGSPDIQFNVTETHRPDRSVTFSTLVQMNNNVMALARTVANMIRLNQVNYQDADAIAESVDAKLANMGQAYHVSQYLDRFVDRR